MELHVYVTTFYGRPTRAFVSTNREFALTSLMNYLCDSLTKREVAKLGVAWAPENYEDIYLGLSRQFSHRVHYVVTTSITALETPVTLPLPVDEPVSLNYERPDSPRTVSKAVYDTKLADGTWAYCAVCVEAMVTRRGEQVSSRDRLAIQRQMTYQSAGALKSHQRTAGHQMLAWKAQHGAEFAVVGYDEKEWLLGLNPGLEFVKVPDLYGPNWGVHRETVTDLLVDKLRVLWTKKRPKEPQPEGWEDLVEVFPKRPQWWARRLFEELPINRV